MEHKEYEQAIFNAVNSLVQRYEQNIPDSKVWSLAPSEFPKRDFGEVPEEHREQAEYETKYLNYIEFHDEVFGVFKENYSHSEPHKTADSLKWLCINGFGEEEKEFVYFSNKLIKFPPSITSSCDEWLDDSLKDIGEHALDSCFGVIEVMEFEQGYFKIWKKLLSVASDEKKAEEKRLVIECFIFVDDNKSNKIMWNEYKNLINCICKDCDLKSLLIEKIAYFINMLVIHGSKNGQPVNIPKFIEEFYSTIAKEEFYNEVTEHEGLQTFCHDLLMAIEDDEERKTVHEKINSLTAY
ncbi:hypothetical protein [Burkholderia cepacia]|uniref:hypothetical protein n=1 Tax=Burkholderia cepacia TaxID=292 RepID=UPI00158A8039|nr:hypothetical protein [Burkholderia cepacia]